MTVATETPRVTMTLFAYNQEAFIRDAIDGAFSQTYQPLEIILSDDCSTDRTFEIMREMVEAYQGPHRVVLRRNAQNLGVIDHYNLVFEMVTSDIIVFAAGDDISLPHRVAVSVERMVKDAGAMLVHSSTIAIDEAGKELGLHPPPITKDDVDPFDLATSESIYIGATGTYRASFLNHFGAIQQKNTFEDLVFGFRAALLDGLRYVEAPLIKYRIGVGVSFKGGDKRENETSRRIVALGRRVSVFKQRKLDLSKVSHPNHFKIEQAIENGVQLDSARHCFQVSKWSFLRGFFSERVIIYIKALGSETKFLLGLMN